MMGGVFFEGYAWQRVICALMGHRWHRETAMSAFLGVRHWRCRRCSRTVSGNRRRAQL